MATILQDQHIIVRSLRDHEALQSNFNIDAPRNRMYLPVAPQLAADMQMSGHDRFNSVHAVYNARVELVLDQLVQIADPVARNSAVTTLQDVLRVALAKGDVYAQRPEGVTEQAAIQRTNQFFSGNFNQYADNHRNEIQANKASSSKAR